MPSPFGLYELLQMGVPYADASGATGTNVPRVMRPPLPSFDYRINQPSGLKMPAGGRAGLPAIQGQPFATKSFTLGPSTSTISDTVYKEVGPQKALSYKPQAQIGYKAPLDNIDAEVRARISKIGKTQVAQTPNSPNKVMFGGRLGGQVIDPSFGALGELLGFKGPQKGDVEDVYKAVRTGLEIHPNTTPAEQGFYKTNHMTTPQAAGFPALQSMSNQAQFEEEFRKSQEMKKSDYGKIPGTGYFQVEGQPRQYLMGDAAKASGGFSRPSTADTNLAREEAEYQQSREISTRRAALDAQELQQSLAQRAQSAISSGDYEQASAFGKMLQQAGGLQIDDYGTQQLAQAQAKALPQQSQQKTNLESAQADYYRAQAAGLPQANAIKAAMALQKAKEGLAENEIKLVEIAMASVNPAQTLTALSTQYPNLKRVAAALLAAEQMAKE